MKTRITVYGLTVFLIIVFFAYEKKLKYDQEKATLSQLNQALALDKLRFSMAETIAEEASFQSQMNAINANAPDRDSTIKALQDAKAGLEQKHKTELENDQRRIDDYSRAHGY